MNYRILHLSDIHIGYAFDDPVEICANIGRKLRENNCRPDIILVTGDIFGHPPKNATNTDGHPESSAAAPVTSVDLTTDNPQLKIALEFFDSLCDEANRGISESGISRRNFIFVPGNHDMVKNKTENTWALYDLFLDQFYKNDIPDVYDQKLHMVKYADTERKILFLGFSSFRYDNSEGRREAVISNNQIWVADQWIKEGGGYTDYYKIVFFHHPFYIFSENTRKPIDGIIKNANEFAQDLTAWDVGLVLHGHKHMPKESVIWPRKAQKITVLAAGSAAANDVNVHSCNVVEISDAVRDNAGKEIRLRRLTTDDSRQPLEDITISDDYQKGLLCRKLADFGMYSELDNSPFGHILRLVDSLFLSYDALNMLQYDSDSCKLFLQSIKYRIEAWKELYGRNHDIIAGIQEKFSDEFGVMLNGIAGETANLLTRKKHFTIGEKIREAVGKEPLVRKRFSYVLLAMFFSDLYLAFSDEYRMQCLREGGYPEDGCGTAGFDSDGIDYDISHGCLYIKLRCGDAETKKSALKMAYGLRNRYEGLFEYFSYIRLEIRNVIPEIRNDNDDNIICYDMDASVPRLIRLLTGVNIYAGDEVFARELIQNAVDAVSFREKLDGSQFDTDIKIQIGRDGQGVFFRITDHGIGMEQEIISQYFSTLGKSFYMEYDPGPDGKPDYNSIGNFGIGFLSVFRPCRKITILTRHFRENLFYRLEIGEPQDYFLIDVGGEDAFEGAGTEITCYLKEEAEGLCQRLIPYISRVMADIKYKICIDNIGQQVTVQARAARRREGTGRMFIPFDEDAGCLGEIPDFHDIINDVFIESEKCRHGLFFCFGTDDNTADRPESTMVLNVGVLMGEAELKYITGMPRNPGQLQYNTAVFNFPPHWLDIDVSREKAIRLNTDFIQMDPDIFRSNLFRSFRQQLRQFTGVYKETTLAAVSEAERFMKEFCLDGIPDAVTMPAAVILHVDFNGNAISFYPEGKMTGWECRGGEWEFRCVYSCPDDDRERRSAFLASMDEAFSGGEAAGLANLAGIGTETDAVENILKTLQFDGWDGVEKRYLPIVLAACLSGDIWSRGDGDGLEEERFFDESEYRIYTLALDKIKKLVKKTVMEQYTLADLGTRRSFSVRYADKRTYKIDDDAEKLEERIQIVAKDYGADEIADADGKTDFIWEYILRKSYQKYYGTGDEIWRKVREAGEKGYIRLKRKTKKLYKADPAARIDIYLVAACYMGSLLRLPGNLFCGDGSDKKYRWILDGGTGLVYMWKLSEYKERNDPKYVLLGKQGSLSWPTGDSYERQIQILRLKDTYHEKLDILSFSELLSWLADYNDRLLGCGQSGEHWNE